MAEYGDILRCHMITKPLTGKTLVEKMLWPKMDMTICHKTLLISKSWDGKV